MVVVSVGCWSLLRAYRNAGAAGCSGPGGSWRFALLGTLLNSCSLQLPPQRITSLTPPLPCFPSRSKSIVDELRPEFPERSKKAQTPYCVCLAWSADGNTLYSGYTDGTIRVWQVRGATLRSAAWVHV